MKTSELLNLIDHHLQEVNSKPTDRVNRIKEILTYLNFNLRLTELSEFEKQDFVNCMEGYPLTEDQRKTLENSTKERKNYYIDMWARSTYMRRCMWLTYLHNESDTKPTGTALKN